VVKAGAKSFFTEYIDTGQRTRNMPLGSCFNEQQESVFVNQRILIGLYKILPFNRKELAYIAGLALLLQHQSLWSKKTERRKGMKKVLLVVFALIIGIAFATTGFAQDKPKAAAPEKAKIGAGESVKEAEPTEAAVGTPGKKPVGMKKAREIRKSQKAGKEGADVKAGEPTEAATGTPGKKPVGMKKAREIRKSQKSGKEGADVKAAEPTEAGVATPAAPKK
jgi:hypothetical protein